MALHSTEDGFKKQLKTFSAELMMAENAAAALAAVQSICDLVELARSRDCLILGPAGVAKLLKGAQVLEIVDDHVLSAFAVLQSQCALHVSDCHKEYAKLQSWRSVSLAALQAVDGSDAAFKRDLAKLEKKEAAAKRKEVAAKKKLDAAQAAWEKTKSEVKSVLEEKSQVQERLAGYAKRRQSFEALVSDFAGQCTALGQRLEEIGEEPPSSGSSSSSHKTVFYIIINIKRIYISRQHSTRKTSWFSAFLKSTPAAFNIFSIRAWVKITND